MRITLARHRRRFAGASLTLALTLVLAGGTTAALAPAASAAPAPGVAAPAAPGLHRVDQLGDLSYQAMFALGVQVYEYATIIREDDSYNPPVYYTVLRKLHTPTQGTPGSRRYGFLGAALPEAFAMYPTPGRPDVLAHSSFIFPVDPRTLTLAPRNGLAQCLGFTIGPVGPLRGGGALASSTCLS